MIKLLIRFLCWNLYIFIFLSIFINGHMSSLQTQKGQFIIADLIRHVPLFNMYISLPYPSWNYHPINQDHLLHLPDGDCVLQLYIAAMRKFGKYRTSDVNARANYPNQQDFFFNLTYLLSQNMLYLTILDSN